MCETALLCRLTCCRFVAASEHGLVTTLGHGKSISYKFEQDRVRITLTVPPADAGEKPTTVTSVARHERLMKPVEPRGRDGGFVFTAALARHVINMSSIAGVHHTTEPGVPSSIERSVDARVIAAVAGAFCRLKVLSYSSSLQTAIFAENVCMTLKNGHVSITTGGNARRISLPAGAAFRRVGSSVLMEAESHLHNSDLVVANVCWTLYAML